MELTLGQVDAGDADGQNVADAVNLAGVLAADLAVPGAQLPPVVAEVLHAQEALDEETRRLDEQAEVRHARDHAVELLADAFGQQLRDQDLTQFALGGLGATVGGGAAPRGVTPVLGTKQLLLQATDDLLELGGAVFDAVDGPADAAVVAVAQRGSDGCGGVAEGAASEVGGHGSAGVVTAAPGGPGGRVDVEVFGHHGRDCLDWRSGAEVAQIRHVWVLRSLSSSSRRTRPTNALEPNRNSRTASANGEAGGSASASWGQAGIRY